jgi:hypothetical protein
MRLMVCGGVVMTTLLAAAAAQACMDYRLSPARLVREVLSDNPDRAREAAAELREIGPAGLGLLMHVYQEDLAARTGRDRVAHPPYGDRIIYPGANGAKGATLQARPAGVAPIDDATRWTRLMTAIDAVAAQKDAAFCGLYWHTDLEKAMAAAREQRKPILSLRLLGTLDTEFSCANSRYFRTVLYANEEVSAALRERFVLHWQSVRPVPKVTIDMGDGRVIERTVTGNSIHYVLDADGRPVDGIPGLYGPRAFLRAIGAAEGVVAELQKIHSRDAQRQHLMAWHQRQAQAAAAQLDNDLATIDATTVHSEMGRRVNSVPAAKTARRVTAVEAGNAAFAKSRAELPIVRALADAAPPQMDDESWTKLSGLRRHREDARLDASSRAVVRVKYPTAQQAGARAESKRMVEDPIVRVVENLQYSIARDTVRNEFDFHLRIHNWFARGDAEAFADDVRPLNERVYAELFLTPSSDPWLGLVPPDTYSALDRNGVRTGTR